MKDPITWHIETESPYHTREAKKLENAIRAECDVLPEDEARLRAFTHYVATTNRIEYVSSARATVRELAHFLETWQTLSPTQVWEFCLRNVPDKIILLWDAAYGEAQELFDRDTAALPLNMLTPEQREEAADPASSFS